jgi:predicted SAM-dependent methyltransferase
MTKEMKPPKNVLNINVASGHYVLKDFINIDNSIFLRMLPIYPIIKPFISKARRGLFQKFHDATKDGLLVRHNCLKRLPFDQDTVDHILCSHFIEHVYRNEAIAILRGFYEILKPSGTLHIIVPDLRKMATKYVAGEASLNADQFMDWIGVTKTARPRALVQYMELTGGFGLFHRWMYDENSLAELLKSTGFTILPVNSTVSADWRVDNNDIQVNLLVQKPGF